MKSMQNSFNSGSIQHEILFENSVTFYEDTMFCFETIPSHEKKRGICYRLSIHFFDKNIKNCMKKAKYV